MPHEAKNTQVYSNKSNLTAESLEARLNQTTMNPAGFARFCGIRADTVYKYLSGRMDGHIPKPIQRCLELVELNPIAALRLPEVRTPVRERNPLRKQADALARQALPQEEPDKAWPNKASYQAWPYKFEDREVSQT